MSRVAARTTSFLLALALAAPASAAQEVTGRGVGQVRLDALYATLHAHGRVGAIGPGCEAAGPQARSAQLNAPLKGSVDFTQTEPRRVANITVRGGAKARGVGVGASAAQLRRAFPHAHYDHSGDKLFGATFVTARAAGGTIGFALNTTTHRVDLIAVPQVAACE